MKKNSCVNWDTKRVGAVLQSLRENAGKKRCDVCEELTEAGIEITTQSLRRYENGITNNMPAPVYLNLCKMYGIGNPYDLANGFAGQNGRSEVLNAEGVLKLQAYRDDLIASGRYTEKAPHETILLPLFDTPVSAGFGEVAESDAGCEYLCNLENCSETPDFAVRVAGNSMEPVLHDGQILFIKRSNGEAPRDNELGVFQYDGENYVKQYTSVGGPRLVSYNPAYKDKVLNPNLEMRFIGRVVGVEAEK
jgi:SOS-response transcriptional repressor LexA